MHVYMYVFMYVCVCTYMGSSWNIPKGSLESHAVKVSIKHK